MNIGDRFGHTPLIMARADGYVDVIDELLKYDQVDVNAQDNDGRTPLIMACSGGHGCRPKSVFCIVCLLLKHKEVDVNATYNKGRTALYVACVKNKWKTVLLI